MNMHFDAQPILTGRLVHLRPLLTSDYDALYKVASDQKIWEQHPIKDRHKASVFGAFFQESLKSGGALVAIDRVAECIIGSSRFHRYSSGESEIEIGWTFLAQSHWGGTYNREMKRLMLEHAFKYVENVLFVVGVQNQRSQRAVEKIGAVHIGNRPDDGGNDSKVYRVTVAEFGNLQISKL